MNVVKVGDVLTGNWFKQENVTAVVIKTGLKNNRIKVRLADGVDDANQTPFLYYSTITKDFRHKDLHPDCKGLTN